MIGKIAIKSVVAITFLVLLTTHVAHARPNIFPKCPDQISNLSAKQCGKYLWRRLNKFYDEYAVNSNASDIDVTRLVLCYIPIGERFADAENILKAAGFTVYPGPWPYDSAIGSSARAEIDHFRNLIIVDPELIVFLMPRTPGHYGYVCSLSANFLFGSL